jgi:hypothetical protein
MVNYMMRVGWIPNRHHWQLGDVENKLVKLFKKVTLLRENSLYSIFYLHFTGTVCKVVAVFLNVIVGTEKGNCLV